MKQFAPRHLALAVVAAGLVVAVIFVMQPSHNTQQTRKCESNLKQIGLAMLQYNRDYDERFPLAANWADVLRPYAIDSHEPGDPQAAFDKMFHCSTTRSFYAYNAHLANVSIVTIEFGNNDSLSPVPLVIEVAAGHGQVNLSGTGELWPASPIHETEGGRGNHVVFADAHVELRQHKPTFRSFAKPKSTGKP